MNLSQRGELPDPSRLFGALIKSIKRATTGEGTFFTNVAQITAPGWSTNWTTSIHCIPSWSGSYNCIMTALNDRLYNDSIE